MPTEQGAFDIGAVLAGDFWYGSTSYRRNNISILLGGVLNTTLRDRVYQWLGTSQWFSPGIPDILKEHLR
jgi:hypothetical protein